MNINTNLRTAQKEYQLAVTQYKTASIKKLMNYTNKNVAPDKGRKTGWTIPGPAERDFSNLDRRTAMAQARQLIEESPLASVILSAHLDFCIGEELFLSVQTPDKAFNEEVEARWLDAKDSLDIRGIRRWGSLVRMWQARNRTDGDVGILLVDGGERTGGGRISKLQTIEADRIWKEPNKADDCGIEYDGNMLALKYWVGQHLAEMTTRSGGFDARRRSSSVDAEHFIFYPHFPEYRAERKRGVSGFTVLLNLLKDVEETDEGLSQKIKNAAFIGLLFRQLQATTEGSLLGDLSDDDIESELAEMADGAPKYVAMKAGTNIHAEDGQTVEVLESKTPSAENMDYLRHRFRLAGLPFGIPLEFLLLDPSGASYSGLMMTGQAMRRRMKPMQADIRNICSRVFRWWMAREIQFNGLKIPSSISAASAAKHRWIIPTGGLIDPAKETDAWALKVEKRLSTRQRAIEEMGDGADFEDVIDEVANEEQYMDEKGVSYQIGDPGAPIANDPNGTEQK